MRGKKLTHLRFLDEHFSEALLQYRHNLARQVGSEKRKIKNYSFALKKTATCNLSKYWYQYFDHFH
jgi:hypothetical protein